MSRQRSPSTSPAKNTPANYESAAREIESEKQMVAALKRLSIGNMMNLDPDIPAQDASFSFLLDREIYGDHDLSSYTGAEADLLPDSDVLSANTANSLGSQDEDSRRAFSTPEDSKGVSQPGSGESQPSSLTEEPRQEELLWVPANMHPEVNPQQFKNHVKTTMDELLERQLSLSRSKSANRSKRSSLSLSTTDIHMIADMENERNKENAKATNHETPSMSQSNLPYDEMKARNRLSSPSLRKLTSELQRMSELAGMDSNDAVALARSLSTTSIGYSDVERTAFDEIESAHNGYNGNTTANLVDTGLDEPVSNVPSPISPSSEAGGSLYHGPYAGHLPHQHHPGHSSRDTSPRGSPVLESHSNFGDFNDGSYGNVSYGRSQSPNPNQAPSSVSHRSSSPNFGGRSNEDFSLRRSRRVDYRKGPSSSLGSQLQNNKAGKLASLRHKIASSNTQEAANLTSLNVVPSNRDNRQYLTVNSPGGGSRTSVQSINPRSSQELFSYKVPSQNQTSGRPRISTSGPSSNNSMPMGGHSTRGSPYSTGKSPDAPGRNSQPNKYGHHILTPKNSVGQNAPHFPSPGSQTYDGRSRNSSRSTSHEHERHHKQSIPGYPNQMSNQGQALNQGHGKYESRDSMSSRNAREHHSGHRRDSPSSPVPSGSRVSSRESPTHVQGPWTNEQGERRNISPATRNMPYGGSRNMVPQYQNQPHVQKYQNNPGAELSKNRQFSKRDKTKELNQNLDLLRNEINEFKESLATKIDSPAPKAQPFKQDEKKAQDGQTDFSFDLTNQDVSYEDTLGIEGDVLTELTTDKPPRSDSEGSKDSLNISETKSDEIVSITETGNTEPSKFRDVVSKDAKITHLSPKDDYAVISKPDVEVKEPHIEEHLTQQKVDHVEHESGAENDAKTPQAHYTRKMADLEGESHSDAESQIKEESRGTEVKSPEYYTQSKVSHPVEIESVHDLQEGTPENHEVMRRNTFESCETYESQHNRNSREQTAEKYSPIEKKKSKKAWPWSKEKQQKSRPDENKGAKEVRAPVRSVSSPEISAEKRDVSSGKEDAIGKENAISKFFKRKRSNSVSHEKPGTDPIQRKLSSDSSENELERQSSHSKVRGKRSSRSSEVSGSEDNASRKSSSIELKRELSNDEAKQTEDNRVTSRIKNRIKSMTKIHEEKDEKPVQPVELSNGPDQAEAGDESKPMSTIEIQEKLKKSIKRHSRPNQPIEFTDSAFGFPLPPPSSSTLIMIDYRFPVHVERAIYRLSHLKLANPKRSLREQVTLSNFMYAYLNLVDHTLHLEQQMSSDDYEVEQPEGDLDFLGDQDVDTEFEADDGFEESDFDEIKLELDAKGNEISA